jgi:hypothetical protein
MGGTDIFIKYECNALKGGKSSSAFSDGTFERPKGLTDEEELNSYLAGARYFVVEEIEIY